MICLTIDIKPLARLGERWDWKPRSEMNCGGFARMSSAVAFEYTCRRIATKPFTIMASLSAWSSIFPSGFLFACSHTWDWQPFTRYFGS